MSPLATQLVETVQANGNEMTWESLVATVDPLQRQRVMAAVREAKKAGQLKTHQAYEPESGLSPLSVQFVGGE